MASRKTSSVVALEFGPSTLRFIEMRPSAGDVPQVLAAGIVALEAGDDAQTHADRIRAVLSQTSAFNRGTIIASVPLRHAFLRIINVPRDLDPHDVPEALRWDMTQYLARPLDRYALDFQPLENDFPDTARYLAAAYRLSEIETLREALVAAGAPALTALDVDALSIVNAFAANYPECLPERTLVIKADVQNTSFFRTLRGEYLGGTVQRESPDAPDFHSLEPQERAEHLLRRARTISLGLGEALGAWGEPERIFLCGDLAGDADFRELLKTGMRAPFALLNPFRKISGPNPETYPAAYPGAPFAATVGLALRAASTDAGVLRLNLLKHLPVSEPGTLKPTRRESRPGAGKRVVLALCLVVFAIVAGFALKHPRWIRSHFQTGAGIFVKSSARPAHAPEDSLKRGLEEEASRLVTGQQDAAISWLQELESPLFSDSVGVGVHILRAVFTAPGVFQIQGFAVNEAALSRFQESLVVVPGLLLTRSDSRAARPTVLNGLRREKSGEGLEFLFSGTLESTPSDSADNLTTERATNRATNRVVPKAETENAMTRFMDAATVAGIDFLNLEAPPATTAGFLEARPYRLMTACGPVGICDPAPLRAFLENESRHGSPFGIQRITMDNTPDSQMVFLDIMAFSR